MIIDGRWEVLLKLYKNIYLIFFYECFVSLFCWREGFLIVVMVFGVGMVFFGGFWRIMFFCVVGGNFDFFIFVFVILYFLELKYLFWNNNVLRFNVYWILDFIIICVYFIYKFINVVKKGIIRSVFIYIIGEYFEISL